MGPNLELVTGSFFTGMSKAGSALGETRHFLKPENKETLFYRNFSSIKIVTVNLRDMNK